MGDVLHKINIVQIFFAFKFEHSISADKAANIVYALINIVKDSDSLKDVSLATSLI